MMKGTRDNKSTISNHLPSSTQESQLKITTKDLKILKLGTLATLGINSIRVLSSTSNLLKDVSNHPKRALLAASTADLTAKIQVGKISSLLKPAWVAATARLHHL
jgi:hypothetical protein